MKSLFCSSHDYFNPIVKLLSCTLKALVWHLLIFTYNEICHIIRVLLKALFYISTKSIKNWRLFFLNKKLINKKGKRTPKMLHLFARKFIQSHCSAWISILSTIKLEIIYWHRKHETRHDVWKWRCWVDDKKMHSPGVML